MLTCSFACILLVHCLVFRDNLLAPVHISPILQCNIFLHLFFSPIYSVTPIFFLNISLFIGQFINPSIFLFIAICLTAMVMWEKRVPGGSPRRGALGLDTTRGDRLFISLLSRAFIHLGWLGLIGPYLWIATIISVAFAVVVFRYF